MKSQATWIQGRSNGFALAIVLAISTPALCADENADDKALLMGVVSKIEGDTLIVAIPATQKAEKKLILTKNTKFSFVGFKGLGQTVDKPGVGFALKANVAKDNTAQSILFTPNFPPYNGIPNKHELTADELFKLCDQNKDGRVDYVEYASCIYQSYKHLPDKFRKRFDTNGDDTLDLREFTASLDLLEWWKLSRKTAEEWLIVADMNKNNKLEKDEARTVIGDAHGKYDEVFGKLDRDKSGGLSVAELEKFLQEAISGKKSTNKGS